MLPEGPQMVLIVMSTFIEHSEVGACQHSRLVVIIVLPWQGSIGHHAYVIPVVTERCFQRLVEASSSRPTTKER